MGVPPATGCSPGNTDAMDDGNAMSNGLDVLTPITLASPPILTPGW